MRPRTASDYLDVRDFRALCEPPARVHRARGFAVPGRFVVATGVQLRTSRGKGQLRLPFVRLYRPFATQRAEATGAVRGFWKGAGTMAVLHISRNGKRAGRL
jgi:hypothetical protein